MVKTYNRNSPKFKKGEEVEGHVTLRSLDGYFYAFNHFRVLSCIQKGPSFEYALEPLTLQSYSPISNSYSNPVIFKVRGEWKAYNEEEREVLGSLEGKLKDKIVLPEREVRRELRFGAGE